MKCELVTDQCTPNLTSPLVIMITALIIVGLLIDLGGLPNNEPPIGFLVRLCASSGMWYANHLIIQRTGRIQVLSLHLQLDLNLSILRSITF
jgi:hypothetical protein